MKLNEFTKVGQMLAKEHKITIEEGNAWAANIKRRQVFYKKEDIYNLSEDHILGLILHEIAHIHYTSDVTIPKKHEELTHSALNMVEDIAIEHIISGDYPNAGEILESTKMEVLDTLVKALPKMKNVSIFEKALLYGATRFDGRGYAFGMEAYEKLGDDLAKIMIARKDEIYNRKSTADLMPLVNDLVNHIIKVAGEPTPEQKQSLMENGMHGHANEGTQQEQTKRQVINKLKGGRGWKEGAILNNQIVFVDAISDQAASIGKQLRTVLKRNNAMEFGGRYRSGKILAKRFVRVRAMKDRRPFARRIVKSNQSYAFAIASDVSGSMFNGRGNSSDPGSYALSSMHMVGEALRYAGVPRSMTVFGTKAVTVAPMGKAQIPWTDLASEISIKRSNPGGTNIAQAIKACTTELSKIRAERKIMIVLTDGASDLYQMQEAHKEATAAGIECLGVSIGQSGYMDTVFSEKKNSTIEDTSKTELIGKTFIDILKTSITKSQ